MDRYTIAQRVEIVKIHYTNGAHFAQTMRKVRTAFGRHHAPSRPAIVKLIRKFESLGQVTDKKSPTHARKARSAENIAAVAESVKNNPDMSIMRRARELGLSATSVHRILYKDLGLPPVPRYPKQETKSVDKGGVEPSKNSLFIGGAIPDFMYD